MASVNKAIILGNLGKDPELRHTPAGKAVATLRIATNEVWTDQSRQNAKSAPSGTRSWCGAARRRTASSTSRRAAAFTSRAACPTRKWQDKEGKDRYSTEIVADRVQFIGGGTAAAAAAAATSKTNPSSRLLPAAAATTSPSSAGRPTTAARLLRWPRSRSLQAYARRRTLAVAG